MASQGSASFGRYWPGTSPVHRMDPRAKLLITLAFIVAAFVAHSFAALAVCTAFFAACALASRVPASALARSVAPLMLIVLITVVFNIAFTHGGRVLVSWGWLTVSEAGVRAAAFMGWRLALLLAGVCLTTLTTQILDITEAFERLLSPLKRIGAPVHEMAMMMGIALRFLPQLAEEARIIRRAQANRGATFSKNPFKGGVSHASSLVVPLFASAFRHAETLSAAMDARCYHGGERTRLAPLRFAKRDAAGAVCVAALLACVIVMRVVL